MKDKTKGRTFNEEQDIYTVSKYLPTRCLLITEGKNAYFLKDIFYIILYIAFFPFVVKDFIDKMGAFE